MKLWPRRAPVVCQHCDREFANDRRLARHLAEVAAAVRERTSDVRRVER